MEDLRSKEQVSNDGKSWKNGKSDRVYLGHIPTFKMILVKLFKKTYKYVLLCGIIYVILTYPNEIGTLIGNWSYSFWTGLMNKF